MEPSEGVLRVLRESGEGLHWTRIQDEALRRGYLDPFEHPDVRRQVQTALRRLVDGGSIERVGKGVYRAVAQPDEA
jgi:hypothetical protein